MKTPKTDALELTQLFHNRPRSIECGEALHHARQIERESQELRDALINLRGWVVANAKTSVHDILRVTDSALAQHNAESSSGEG